MKSGLFGSPASRRSIACGAILTATLVFPDVAVPQADTAGDRYRITLAADLSELSVTARFAEPVASVRARDRDAARYLRNAEDCDGVTLRRRGRSLEARSGMLTCLNYRVDLAAAAAGERRARYLAAGNVSVSPSIWLWRPRLDGERQMIVAFDLPEGLNVAVPWQPVPGDRTAFRLEASPESSHAPALFGRFSYREVDVGGARLRIALARGQRPYQEDDVVDWVTATATDVSLAYGRFPNPSPLVVVLPVSSEGRFGRSPVPFGRVIRDGGEAIELFVDPAGRLEDFLGDWTATHEFSHLMLPYLASSARWISEGFAQYYQNVLMARSGAYDEATAWQKIVAGLDRGAAARPELSPNDAAGERRRGARMKVYWSGAALALLGDVELRRRTNGRESLDTLLDRLQRCCLPSDKVWSGPEFLARLDALAGIDVFVPLYRAYADRPGFPPTAGLLEELGVDTSGGRVSLRQDREGAAIRRDIMRRHEDIASWRRDLAGTP